MFEAYSIAIRLSLINGVTSGLLGLSRQFQAADKDAKSLQKSLDGVKAKMVFGAAMTGGGLGILGGVYHLAKSATDYGSQLALINQLGMSQKDIAAGVGAAWKTAFDVPTSKIAENMVILREMRSLFGSNPAQEAEARAMLPMVQRMAGVMQAFTGREQKHIGIDFAKVAEMRTPGVMTPQALIKNGDLMSRALIAMGGTLNANDFHAAFRQGKMATMKWDDTFAYGMLPTLMQEMKSGPMATAQSAGTAIMALYRVVHGRMEKKALPYWGGLGLLDARGNVRGAELFERNPLAYVQQYLSHAAVENAANRKHISVETYFDRMASNKNAGFALYTMYMKGQQFKRDSDLIMKARTSEQAYANLLKTDPRLAGLALQAQYDNLKTVFGIQVLPELVKGIQVLMPLLRDFTKWTKEHSTATKAIMAGVIGVGGLLAIAGGITIIKGAADAFGILFGVFSAQGFLTSTALPAIGSALGAVSGAVATFAATVGWWTLPIVAGLTAIGGGIYFIASRWNTHKSVFENIKTGLSAYGGWLIKFGDDLLKKVRRWEDSPSKHKADTPKMLVGFVDGMMSGVIGEIAKWSKLAKGAWNEMVKWWSPVTNKLVSGISDFLAKLDKLGKIAHALMPWAFKDSPKPPGAAVSSTAPMTARDFGAFVGRNAVNSFVGSMLHIPVVPVAPPRKAMVPSGPTGGKQPIHTTVNLDGRPIAKVVSYYQEKDMDFAARSGSSQIDPRRSLTPAGLSFA